MTKAYVINKVNDDLTLESVWTLYPEQLDKILTLAFQNGDDDTRFTIHCIRGIMESLDKAHA